MENASQDYWRGLTATQIPQMRMEINLHKNNEPNKTSNTWAIWLNYRHTSGDSDDNDKIQNSKSDDQRTVSEKCVIDTNVIDKSVHCECHETVYWIWLCLLYNSV